MRRLLLLLPLLPRLVVATPAKRGQGASWLLVCVLLVWWWLMLSSSQSARPGQVWWGEVGVKSAAKKGGAPFFSLHRLAAPQPSKRRPQRPNGAAATSVPSKPPPTHAFIRPPSEQRKGMSKRASAPLTGPNARRPSCSCTSHRLPLVARCRLLQRHSIRAAAAPRRSSEDPPSCQSERRGDEHTLKAHADSSSRPPVCRNGRLSFQPPSVEAPQPLTPLLPFRLTRPKKSGFKQATSPQGQCAWAFLSARELSNALVIDHRLIPQRAAAATALKQPLTTPTESLRLDKRAQPDTPSVEVRRSACWRVPKMRGGSEPEAAWRELEASVTHPWIHASTQRKNGSRGHAACI